MTEKRFENRLNKDNIKFRTQNPVWDNEKEDAFNVFEMVELLNTLHEENQHLKEKIKYLQKLRMAIRDVTIKEAIDKIEEMWE